MTDKTTLGNRMKQYESAYDTQFPIKLPLLVRWDGHGFSKQVKKWHCEKPFDSLLVEAMQKTALTLCENIAGAHIAYTQSDEITMLIRDDMSYKTEPVFKKRLNKILSIFSAKASNAFNYHFFRLHDIVDQYIPLTHMAEFDCRAWILPENEVFNAFLWRQRDFEKNSVQMLGRSKYSHNALDKVTGNQIQDMLMTEHGINWNDLPTHLKRGSCIIREEIPKEVPKRNDKGKVIEGEFENVMRNQWKIDTEIPIFTQGPEYINQFTKACV